MKFVEHPDPDHKYQAPWDAELMANIETHDIRNAFIRMLLDRWDKRVLQFKIIPVPNEIKDTSSDFIDDSSSTERGSHGLDVSGSSARCTTRARYRRDYQSSSPEATV